MNLSDLVILFRLLRKLVLSTSPVAIAVRGPVITVLLLVGLLLGAASVREGGVRSALRLLLTDPHASGSMQTTLRSVARRDAVIDQLLQVVLTKAPTAARARLAIIHNGEIGLTGVGLLRFDVTHGRARQGFAVGSFVTNGPLADWNPYLEKLLAGQCSLAGLEAMSAAERGQMVDLGVQERLACPVADINGRLLGGLFITWSTGAAVPEGEEMLALDDFTRSIAGQIAAAMIVAGEPD